MTPIKENGIRDEFHDFSYNELVEGSVLVLPYAKTSRWFPRFTNLGRWDLEVVTDENDIEKITAEILDPDFESYRHSFYKLVLKREAPYYTPRDPNRSIDTLFEETAEIRTEIKQKSRKRKKECEQLGMSNDKINMELQANLNLCSLVPDIIDMLDYYRGILTSEQSTYLVNTFLERAHAGQLTYAWTLGFQDEITVMASATLESEKYYSKSPKLEKGFSGSGYFSNSFPHFISRPAPMMLTISLFNKFFTGKFRTSPRGMHRDFEVSADAIPRNPSDFRDHDNNHDTSIYYDYKLMPKSLRKAYTAAQARIQKKIDLAPEPLKARLEIIYFYMWHEGSSNLPNLFPGRAYRMKDSLYSIMNLLSNIYREEGHKLDQTYQTLMDSARVEYSEALSYFINMIDEDATWVEWLQGRIF